jgi:carbon-monoxide dehydrogenase large subunit
MNDQTPTSAERAEKLQGMGCKRKRVEDVRFVQGKGNYIDDLKLPGMLYGDFTRSSHAHARVKKIDTTKAAAVPGVVAVITAETLKTVNLAWMPTLAGDVQMVLADGKVLFQNQEIAFVIAEDRYTAADAAELVEVEYEALPVNVDPLKAMAKDAPVIREDIKDKTEGAHGKRKHYNHVFNWQAGNKAATDAAFAKADVTINEFIVYPRVHPCPLETCQCIASFDKVTGELTLHGTFQAPHVIRTVGSLISKIPEHKIHVIAPDIGGGFGNKVGAYSGYICSIVASIVTGRPVKWTEDRIENLSTTAFARDFHMQTEIACTKDGKVTGLRCYTVADHGAFDACANASKWPAGLFSIITGSYDFPAAHVSVDGVYTNKAPGGVAYRCSFRVTEAAYAIERAMDIMAQKLKMDPVEFRMKNLIRREQFPYTSATGWLRRLSHRDDQGGGDGQLQEVARGTESQAGRIQARRHARADGNRRCVLYRNRRRRPLAQLRHSRHCDVRFGRNPHSSHRHRHLPARNEVAGAGPRDDLRTDYRHRAWSARRQYRGRGRQHRHRTLWSRHLRLAFDTGFRRSDRDGVPQDQGESADDCGLHARGARRRS